MYKFPDNVVEEISEKTNEIYKFLNIQVPENYFDEFKEFHSIARINQRFMKCFIKQNMTKYKKELENDKDEIIIPLNEYLSNNVVWQYLHIMFLLFENSHDKMDNELLSALAKKIDTVTTPVDKQKIDLGEILKSDSNGVSLNDMMKSMSSDPNINKMMKGMMSGNNMENMMKSMMNDEDGGISNLLNNPLLQNFQNKSVNSNLLNTIIGDIKDNLNNNSGDIDTLINNTKEMGKKYQDLVTSGQMSMDEMLGSMMGIISNPEEIAKSVGEIDISKLPDPEKLIEKLSSELGTDGAQMMQNMKDMMNNQGDDHNFNPASLISTLMSGVSDKGNKSDIQLTPEQIQEMEEFYSKLQLS